METNNLLIKDSLQYIGGELIDILDFELDDLKIDKESMKILLFITLIISVKIKNLSTNCIYQLKMFLDIF